MTGELTCWGDFDFEDAPIIIGKLTAEEKRGKISYSFEYDDSYLNRKYNFVLSPDMPPILSRHSTFGDRMFGLLEDACPESWGRALIREKLRIKEPDLKFIPEMRYLEEVDDETRMGALRFSETIDGPFISSDAKPVPPITDLRKLEALSRDYENENIDDEWLLNLARQGSSLGGARPKASIRDTDGSLLVAKFPSVLDEYDIGALEYIVRKSAKYCGLNVPESFYARRFLEERHHTYLVSRFDRTEDGKRIHTASAMTLSGKKDGDEASLLDLIDLIYAYSADVETDLREMYMRTLFSLKVNNTDNHLRNHSFVLRKDGWHLSPLYDVNISPYGNTFALALEDDDREWNLERILDISDLFMLSRTEAEDISRNMNKEIISSFSLEAGKLGLSPSEKDRFTFLLNLR